MASKKKAAQAVGSTVEEIIPATIVEGSEQEIFTESALEALEVVEQPEVAVQTEKPKKPSKRPYIAAVQEMLEVGAYDSKQIVAKVLEDFPEVKKGGIQTFVTDLKNIKYAHFKPRVAVVNPAGKLQFSDKVVLAETPPTEVQPVEEAQTTDEPTEQGGE